MTIDITAPPSVQVTAIVRAPIDKVWGLFKPFGAEMMGWWDIYKSVSLDAPGKDEVGAVRSFQTKTGRSYKEKLVARDDEKRFERYDYVSSDAPISIDGIATTVQMAEVAGNTQVTWSSWTVGGGILRGTILSTQQETYKHAIACLDHHFNPSLGKVEVHVTSAAGLHGGSILPVNPYVTVQLDDGIPQRTTVRFLKSAPVFNETLTLRIDSAEGRLLLMVWDFSLGRDDLLGEARVDLHTLKNGQSVVRTLDLMSGPGGKLTVGLKLLLDKGDALPETDEQQQINHMAHIQGILKKLSDQAMALVHQASQGPEKVYGYGRYNRAPSMPDVPLEELPRLTVGLPPEQALSPNKLSRMVERGIEYLYSQSQFLVRAERDKADPFRAFFGGWIKAPDYTLAHWHDDAELARQFIQGVGPMVIRVVTDVAQVPVGMRGLSPGGRTLEQLIQDKSLFILDYEALAPLSLYRDMYFYAPIVLVYKEQLPDGERRLNLAAIQLTRDPVSNVIYTPGSSTPNRWLLAKLHVACADNQYHQWLFHLGYAHLAMEPFAIAAHNALPPDHAIARLLAPHFQDTIGINFLARQTLVSEVAPFTDQTFSTGTAGALKMFLGAWKKYQFFARAFPAELASRGFDEQKTDGLEGYWFREDGFQVWNAIGDYVRAVVDHFYKDDAAVAADAALQAWAAESTDPARADIPGFPVAFGDKALLVKTLQTLIWAVSAQHSAVNFPQFDFLSYVPNRPDSLFQPMPAGDGDIDPSVIQKALPNPLISHFQISFSWLLTLPAELPLTAVNVFEDIHPFKERLAEVSARIHARNEALVAAGKPAYPYLQPERVASSIAI